MTDCTVCLGKHDQEIHEATRRVRLWFRDQTTLGMSKVEKGQPKVGGSLTTGVIMEKSVPGPGWEDYR